jgi:outer membrane protein N
MNTTAGGDKADAWTAGLKYDANNIYLAAMYSETRNMTPYGDNTDAVANKTQNFEVTAQYQFDFGLRPSLSYLQSKGKDLGNGQGDQDLVKYADVGATYYFNKNMSTYVDYKINLLDEDDSFYKTTASARMMSWRWAWFTSSDCQSPHHAGSPILKFVTKAGSEITWLRVS